MNPSQAGIRLFCVVVIKNNGAAYSALIYSFPSSVLLLCVFPAHWLQSQLQTLHCTALYCTAVEGCVLIYRAVQ